MMKSLKNMLKQDKEKYTCLLYTSHPEKAKEKDAPERTAPDKSEADKFLDEVMAKPNPTKEEPHTVNPTEARTEKQNQSVPSSKNNRDSKDRSADARTAEERRPSVRKELKEIREEMDRRCV